MTGHNPTLAKPASDVTAITGFIGLAGLLVWVVICRNWAGIGETFGLPGPRAPLAGPYASLAALLFSAVPMMAWAVFVEKVHRNPSTGIDWDNPKPVSDILDISITKIAGLWATWAVIGFFYCVARWYWDGQYLFAMEVLGFAAMPLFILSVPYVLWIDRVMKQPRDHSWHFGALLIGREEWDAAEVKKHWRAWMIKGFFTAFMISILPGLFALVVNADIPVLIQDPVTFAVLLFNVLFLIDVQIGTVGYLVTFRPLDAHIRSGNPFLAGWLAALLCYPPLNQAGIFTYQVNTADWAHWFAGQTTLLWVWGAWLVVLTAIYAWATIAFGLRFSNLTYRGVITNGPYAFTRHPAYLSKNAFWWFSIMPFLVTNGSWTDMVRNTVFLAVFSGIYYWRARTEEAHLLAEDPKYREYYDWMSENGIITAPLTKLARRLKSRTSNPAVVQPAE